MFVLRMETPIGRTWGSQLGCRVSEGKPPCTPRLHFLVQSPACRRDLQKQWLACIFRQWPSVWLWSQRLLSRNLSSADYSPGTTGKWLILLRHTVPLLLSEANNIYLLEKRLCEIACKFPKECPTHNRHWVKRNALFFCSLSLSVNFWS